MFDPALLDPIRFDRMVAELAEEVSAGARSAEDASPFDGRNDIATRKATVDTLASLASDPLLARLRAWVAHLCVVRVTWREKVAAERAYRAEGDPSLRDRVVTLLETFPDVPHARERGGALVGHAATVAPAVLHLIDRRLEAERLLGETFAIEAASRRASARVLVESAATAFAALGDRPTWIAALEQALGRSAGEGWPARIGHRWIADLFRKTPALEGVSLPPIALPSPLGAASFSLALRRFGETFAFRDRDPKLPFALARAPFDRSAARFGALLALLPLEPAFHVRILGLGQERAREQAAAVRRAFGHALRFTILGAQASATSVIRRDDVADAHEGLGSTLFDVPIPGSAALAFPFARADDAGRLVALVEAFEASVTLRDRFDADWFHNPSAWLHLRHALHAPQADAAVLSPEEEKRLAASMNALASSWV